MKTTYFNSLIKQISIIILVCLYAPTITAQIYQLSGCVKNEKQEAVDVANVLLLHAADSTYQDGIITDMNGCFTLNESKGNYIIRISLLGYQDLFIPVSLNKNIDLGNQVLQEGSMILEEVTVTGSKPIIKREVDRIVFDATNSIASVGGSALDLLRDVPGLKVDQSSISIIGKGGVKVYINDRETKLSGDDLIDYLRSYSANQIGKVEVITTPPARYDAEGNAGIINIRLKARRNDYMGGTASSSYICGDKNNQGNSSLNLNYSQGRISAFVNGGVTYGDYQYLERNISHYPLNSWKSRTDYDYDANSIYGQGGLDMELNNRWNIGTQITYSHRTNDSEARNRSEVRALQAVAIDSTLTSLNNGDFSADRVNVNFHTDKSWGTLGKKMILDIDYLNDKQNTKGVFRSHTMNPDGNKIIGSDFNYDNDRKRKVDVISSTIDFILPCDGYSMSAGGKAAYTHTRNHITYANSTFDQLQNDYFQYREQIYALYADYSRKIENHFTFKLGLRLEHTRTQGISESENRTDEHAYTRLFPTAYFLYTPNETHSLSLSFSNRLSRPAHNMVNPFTVYQNSHLHTKGKEDLQPSYSYDTELSYTLKNNFNVTAYYSYSTDGISQVMTLDSLTNITSALWDNFLTSHQFGITNSYTLRVKWWQAYLQHGVSYSKNTSNSPVTLAEITGWNYNAAVRNIFFLNKQKTFIGSLSATYMSPAKMGVYSLEQDYNISAGVRYSLLKNKLNLSLNVNNLLLSHMKGEVISNGMKMEIDNSFSFTSVSIGASYTFGANIGSKQRSGSNKDIQKRL